MAKTHNYHLLDKFGFSCTSHVTDSKIINSRRKKYSSESKHGATGFTVQNNTIIGRLDTNMGRGMSDQVDHDKLTRQCQTLLQACEIQQDNEGQGLRLVPGLDMMDLGMLRDEVSLAPREIREDNPMLEMPILGDILDEQVWVDMQGQNVKELTNKKGEELKL